jgi:hypothetical protein
MQDENNPAEPRQQTASERSGYRPPPNFLSRLNSPEVRFWCCFCSKLLTRPDPIYPYLNASICKDCARLNPGARILEESVSNKRPAPWSKQEVKSLNEYQVGDLLPYVCLKGHVLKANEDGLTCLFCARYSLTWAYDWTLKYGWL